MQTDEDTHHDESRAETLQGDLEDSQCFWVRLVGKRSGHYFQL